MSTDTSALEQMEREILGIAQDMNAIARGEGEIPDAIFEALQIYARQLAQSAPRGKTGYLRNSIRAIAQGNRYGITMVDYGYFQNFGVSGTQNDIGLTVPAWSGLQPSSGSQFKFKRRTISDKSGLPFPVRRSIARFGIKPRRFFLTTDQDMTTLADRIFNIIENTILSDG